ncbi:hypothetical protein BN2497_827 [Janthinobacterium sp. CG23_2]|nr:hypothetical protein BN2497_827 [Janthinobacterium sp. CG23_2]CUU26811.1 hypothetical protein BN3177_827 [Janthinobacterium sp. CG23_2]
MELSYPFSYSSTIETGFLHGQHMNIALGLRALALLVFVAASTAVIVMPHLLGGDLQILHSGVALSHS